MKKFDLNLMLNFYIAFYVSLLLKNFMSLIAVIPIVWLLYKNLKRNSLTPMINYLIMLLGIILTFVFKEKSHYIIILLTSFISLYLFNSERSCLFSGLLFLIVLASLSSQMELFALIPAIFIFTLRELKSSNIKFGPITSIVVIGIVILASLIPNYQGVINNRSVVSFRTQSMTKSATYVRTVYNYTTKPSTQLLNRLSEMKKDYSVLNAQQRVLNWVVFAGFILAAVFLFVLIYKYVRISSKKTFFVSIFLAVVLVVGLGFGFYKIVSSMKGNWNYLSKSAISQGKISNNLHQIVKHVNIKPLLNKIDALKVNVVSMYLILAEMVLAVVVIFVLLKVIANVQTKGNKKIDVQILESKKTWFKNFGLSSDVFKLYNQFRASFENKSYTPREFQEFFLSKYSIDINGITSLFEKARYMGQDLQNDEKKVFIDGVLKVIDKLLQ